MTHDSPHYLRRTVVYARYRYLRELRSVEMFFPCREGNGHFCFEILVILDVSSVSPSFRQRGGKRYTYKFTNTMQ